MPPWWPPRSIDPICEPIDPTQACFPPPGRHFIPGFGEARKGGFNLPQLSLPLAAPCAMGTRPRLKPRPQSDRSGPKAPVWAGGGGRRGQNQGAVARGAAAIVRGPKPRLHRVALCCGASISPKPRPKAGPRGPFGWVATPGTRWGAPIWSPRPLCPSNPQAQVDPFAC